MSFLAEFLPKRCPVVVGHPQNGKWNVKDFRCNSSFHARTGHAWGNAVQRCFPSSLSRTISPYSPHCPPIPSPSPSVSTRRMFWTLSSSRRWEEWALIWLMMNFTPSLHQEARPSLGRRRCFTSQHNTTHHTHHRTSHNASYHTATPTWSISP